MSPYRLTRKAEEDVIGIYANGLRMFGSAQAARYHDELETVFQLLGENPGMARERREITPPVRIHPYKAHIIVYVPDATGILIIRVRHGHEDWAEEAP